MKTEIYLDMAAAHPAAGKPAKRAGAGKKKTRSYHIVGAVSPDSFNVRGSADAAGYLRQTPAP